MNITGQISISCPAGSRCATSTIPRRRARISPISTTAQSNPIVLARANYWRGRAAEAIGAKDEMRASYEAAARYPTAYYGQLARAKLGLDKIELRPPLQPDPVNRPAGFRTNSCAPPTCSIRSASATSCCIS